MNCFRHLDSLFPSGADRVFGEVVSVSATLLDGDVSLGIISGKREARHANASVSAWHLHRGLCADLRSASCTKGVHLTRPQRILCHRGLRALVAWAYDTNYWTSFQYYDAVLDVRTGGWYIS